jgi:threonine dehydrogenase-like Zn-dependent dehydrogenase
MATAVGAIYGYSHTAGGYDGGQAEYVRVPFADVNPMVIPNDIDVDDAVLLTDAVPTGYQGAEMADIHEGDTVVVFGAGRVIVLDFLDYRLDFVRNFAPCEVYNLTEIDDPVVFLKKLTDGPGPDACIDAVGCEASGSKLQGITGVKLGVQAGSGIAVQWAINSVKKGGSVSIVGVYGPTGNLIPLGNAVNKGLTLRMNQASVKRHVPRLIEHIRAGDVRPSEVITHRSSPRGGGGRVPPVLEQARRLHQADLGSAEGEPSLEESGYGHRNCKSKRERLGLRPRREGPPRVPDVEEARGGNRCPLVDAARAGPPVPGVSLDRAVAHDLRLRHGDAAAGPLGARAPVRVPLRRRPLGALAPAGAGRPDQRPRGRRRRSPARARSERL